MFKKILVSFAAILAVFSIIVALRPSEFHVERSAAISASPAVVFEQVNDLHKWEAWSPWAKLDPKAKVSYEGPAAGNGATFHWDGNNAVGAGSMTIADSRPNELVKFNLEFLKPFKGTNVATFTFKPQGEQTLVTWSMDGKNNFISKAIGLFIDCDKMVGGQFEKGLADMKTIAEAAKP
ncbi:MAG: SRPBCC family protein [Deltaproteobacteria bacterium]|nr:SRPBCC family protein [Deltaproteobacteria bacterium]